MLRVFPRSYSHPSAPAGLFFPAPLSPSPAHCQRSHLLSRVRYQLRLLRVQAHMPFPGLSPRQSLTRFFLLHLVRRNFSSSKVFFPSPSRTSSLVCEPWTRRFDLNSHEITHQHFLLHKLHVFH